MLCNGENDVGFTLHECIPTMSTVEIEPMTFATLRPFDRVAQLAEHWDLGAFQRSQVRFPPRSDIDSSLPGVNINSN